MTKKLPTVALVGRVNVGKSTLFNKMVGKRQALESPVAGTTRDYNQAAVIWRSCAFEIIDTGGFIDGKPADELEQATLEIAQQQTKSADLVVFVIDYKHGITPYDRELFTTVRKQQRPTIVVINKVDKSAEYENSIAEASEFGCEYNIPVSAITGRGTGDLLDLICELLPAQSISDEDIEAARPKLPHADIELAIVGQPNAGKSSILNTIAGYERAMVSSIAHTTRDTNDLFLQHNDRTIHVIDTAGIRKNKQAGNLIEKFSIDASLKHLRRSHVALLVLDISKSITQQDKHLAERIIATKNSTIIIANKWDLIPDKETNTINEYTDYIYSKLPFLTWAPIIFTSAETGKRIPEVLDMAVTAWEERFREISENALDKFLKKVIRKHKPSRGKGVAHPYVYRIRQTGTNPPAFELTIKYQQSLHESYVRFIENQLREQFGFLGTPITIYVQSIK